jgi:hypothetical protein
MTDARADDEAEARALNRLPTLQERRALLEQIAHARGQDTADRIKKLAFDIWPAGGES